jgi:hypothetical protein
MVHHRVVQDRRVVPLLDPFFLRVERGEESESIERRLRAIVGDAECGIFVTNTENEIRDLPLRAGAAHTELRIAITDVVVELPRQMAANVDSVAILN